MNGKKGVSLVETIIAILIIAIAAIGTLQFYVFCRKSFITSSITKPMAAGFARETMEDLYLQGYANFTAGNYPVNLPASDANISDPLLDPQHSGTRYYNVTDTTNYRVIDVYVDWNQ